MEAQFGKYIQFLLIVDGHIIMFIENFKSIEEFEQSTRYEYFKSQFGDLLKRNSTTNEYFEYKQADASLTLILSNSHGSEGNFKFFLKNFLLLLSIPSNYREDIERNIIISYSENWGGYMYHTGIIINQLQEQNIFFDYLVLGERESREVRYTSKF